VSLTVVIPTFNSAEFIERTVLAVCDCLVGIGLREINVVSDASTDNTTSVLKNIQDVPSQVKLRVFSMGINVGQTNATAVGLSHTTSDFVLTLDDDLKDDLASVQSLLTALQVNNFDFVVGAPETAVNGRLRSIASEIIRRIGVRLYQTPVGFRFSSLCLYSKTFLQRSQIDSQSHFEIGWMFRLTKSYSNILTQSRKGLRSHSNFSFKRLIHTALPLVRALIQNRIYLIGTLGAALTVVSAVAIAVFLIHRATTDAILPGFTSLYLLLLLNSGLVGLICQRVFNASFLNASHIDIRRVTRELT
jgi:glycosyltransferase involved in cell wall biosynthesis